MKIRLCGELMNYIPLAYLYCSRIRKLGSALSQRLKSLVFEWFIIGTPAWWFYTHGTLEHTPAFMFLYLLALLTLNAIYEIGYIVNDVYAVKREDHPTLRPEAKRIDPPIAITARLATALASTYALVEFGGTSPYNVAAAAALLAYAIALHNSVKVKAWRIHTFTLLRVSKYIFAPLIVLGDLYQSLLVLLATLPVIVSMMTEWYMKRTIREYGLGNPSSMANAPRYLVYGAPIPLYMVVAGLDNAAAYAVNYLMFASGLARHLKEKGGEKT